VTVLWALKPLASFNYLYTCVILDTHHVDVRVAGNDSMSDM